MSKIISSFTNRLIHKGHIPEEDREIYIYGFDITLYTIWSTSILLLTGLVLRQFTAAVVLVFGFYTFQTTGGGYHADTHLKCLLTMFIGLLAGLSFVYLKDHQILLWILLSIGALLLLLFPLALHPNHEVNSGDTFIPIVYRYSQHFLEQNASCIRSSVSFGWDIKD